jgi:hypothetical protein
VSDIDYGARARLDYIEKQLQALFPDGYVPFDRSDPTGVPQAVIDLARSGNVIAAIKEYRQITGAGLAEAKTAVENIK